MIKKVGIIGMGALGLLYADLIVNNISYNAVDFIVDAKRMKKYRNMEFTINRREVNFNMIDYHNAKPYDLVIIAVKGTALELALEQISKCIGSETIIISLLNGINSEIMISQHYGKEKVVHTIAQGMDAVKFDGNLVFTKPGQLLLGGLNVCMNDKLEELTNFFDCAKIPYELKDNILYNMWAKFMLNVGINQVCMAYDVNYGEALLKENIYNILIKAMREVIELSYLEGINLSDKEIDTYLDLIESLDPQGLPSMAQDAKVHRYSEVEMFAGTVISLARKHKLKVPTNEFLYQRIKEIENSY